MRKSFFLLALLLGCLTSHAALGCCNLECIENKEYIDLEQIVLSQEGLFVSFENGLESVSLIAQDGNGIYCVKSTWKCQRCGYVNPWYRTKCGGCGY